MARLVTLLVLARNMEPDIMMSMTGDLVVANLVIYEQINQTETYTHVCVEIRLQKEIASLT